MVFQLACAGVGFRETHPKESHASDPRAGILPTLPPDRPTTIKRNEKRKQARHRARGLSAPHGGLNYNDKHRAARSNLRAPGRRRQMLQARASAASCGVLAHPQAGHASRRTRPECEHHPPGGREATARRRKGCRAAAGRRGCLRGRSLTLRLGTPRGEPGPSENTPQPPGARRGAEPSTRMATGAQ